MRIARGNTTRREFHRQALGLGAASLAHGVDLGGVRIGAQSYSFRDLLFNGAGDPIDELLAALNKAGLDECELMQSHTEPREFLSPNALTAISRDGRVSESSLYGEPRGELPKPDPERTAALAKWRATVTMDHFKAMRVKFDRARVRLFAFNATFGNSGQWWRPGQNPAAGEELDWIFQVAKALGVEVITSSTTLERARQIVPFAAKYKVMVGMHNHANAKDPNQFATPESFTTAVGLSKWFGINLDIGHFTAAGFDALPFLERHYARITNVHLKDRKNNGGSNVPWGEGDTPIKPVLRLMQSRHYKFPAMIEWEYQGSGRSEIEVPKCVDFIRSALK